MALRVRRQRRSERRVCSSTNPITLALCADCRPSCPSRLAHPKNVNLHESVAEAAGFRACRRCNPGGMSVEAANHTVVVKACRLLEEAIEPISLAQLADAVELSPQYFHRLFKKTIGLTPKAYATARHSNRLRDGLAKAHTVTQAFHKAGFGSNGRFYETSTGVLGMTPSHYKAGGTNKRLTFALGQCTLGAILVASSTKGVAAILLGDDPEALVQDLENRFPKARLVCGDAAYELRVAQVVGLAEAPERGLALPLDVRGTGFNTASGWRCARFPQAKWRTTSPSQKKQDHPKPCAPWPAHARPTH